MATFIHGAGGGSGNKERYVVTSETVLASGWSNGVYSAFQTTYPAASYDIEVQLNGDSVTADLVDVWNDAQVVGSATTNNIIALGTTPTVDIPVIVKATPTTDSYLSDIENLLSNV